MKTPIPLVVIAWLAIACQERTDRIVEPKPSTIEYKVAPSGEAGQKVDFKAAPKEDRGVDSGCKFEDGTYFAAVEYHNPRTGHTAKYDLQVQVEDCQVIRINFPNSGWLDEDHIPRTPINKDGEAALKDDKGREWKVHLR